MINHLKWNVFLAKKAYSTLTSMTIVSASHVHIVKKMKFRADNVNQIKTLQDVHVNQDITGTTTQGPASLAAGAVVITRLISMFQNVKI